MNLVFKVISFFTEQLMDFFFLNTLYAKFLVLKLLS